jgi:hypothetical protein
VFFVQLIPDGILTPELMAVNPESHCRTSKVATISHCPSVRSCAVGIREGNGSLGTLGHRQMMSPSAMNLQHRLVREQSMGLSFDQRQAQWRINLFWRQLHAITSAEPAHFGVYTDEMLSRWRALRGFRKTLEDDHD